MFLQWHYVDALTISAHSNTTMDTHRMTNSRNRFFDIRFSLSFFFTTLFSSATFQFVPFSLLYFVFELHTQYQILLHFYHTSHANRSNVDVIVIWFLNSKRAKWLPAYRYISYFYKVDLLSMIERMANNRRKEKYKITYGNPCRSNIRFIFF